MHVAVVLVKKMEINYTTPFAEVDILIGILLTYCTQANQYYDVHFYTTAGLSMRTHEHFLLVRREH